MTRTRCTWGDSHPLYVIYHDEEWGVPQHDDRALFELLVLEGAQAGLSWLTVLKKRASYRAAFDNFDAQQIAGYGSEKIAELMANPGIIRNRRKIEAAIGNARAFLAVQQEFKTFDSYIWGLAGGRPKVNAWRALSEIPAQTPEAAALSKDLLKRGFKFVGPTICYAFMQATGMVNDHLVSCFRYAELSQERSG
jgi:DNA-3-methyladenine glycosylase I